MATETRNNGSKPACIGCAHFYVTWDEAFPKGCRALGFKSRTMPYQAVLSASGMECQMFKAKVLAKKGREDASQ